MKLVLPALLAFTTVASNAFAQSKERLHDEMLALAREARLLEQHGLPSGEPRACYAALSESLGGDDPAQFGRVTTGPGALEPLPLSTPQSAVSPTCVGQTPTVTTFTHSTPHAIPHWGSVSVSMSVSGLGSYLVDVDLRTYIAHPSPGELTVRLTAPGGNYISVVVSSRNGGSAGDAFYGTLWDDSAHARPVTDHVFASGVVATPLNAEGSLIAFCGQGSVNPNGSWAISVQDDFSGNAGSLDAWELTFATLPSAPPLVVRTVTSSPNAPIPDLGTLNLDVVVPPQLFPSGTSCVSDVLLELALVHEFPSDLDMWLVSPSGTRVLLSSDNGGSNDAMFDGVYLDEAWLTPVTDAPAGSQGFAPEGAFANFKGEDPAGTWRLEVADDAALDTGVVHSVTLWLFGAGASIPTAASYCTAGTSSFGCNALLSGQGFPSASTPDGFTLRVAGLDGQKQGGLLYGTSGRQTAPWGIGGTSTWCVRLPVQRMGLLSSGGNAGACDGSFALDWNAWRSAHPDALGQPLAAGQTIDVQAWFRDPPAPKSASLSDALEFTLLP